MVVGAAMLRCSTAVFELHTMVVTGGCDQWPMDGVGVSKERDRVCYCGSCIISASKHS